MKFLSTCISVIVLFAVSIGLNMIAAETDSVTATVTAENISVSVSDGAIAYGTVGTSSSADTTSAGVDDSQTATNDGNITEDFNIQGTDSAAWTLEATAGADQYTHGFCTATCDTTPSWTQFAQGSYTTLATGVSASGNQIFDLRLQTPTSTATFTQQSVDVTVQAVAN